MAEQLSLFGSPEPKEAPKSAAPAAAPAQPEPVSEPVVAYASVVLDIPARVLSEPFAYGTPQSLANDAQVGSTVLVHLATVRPQATSSTLRPSLPTCKVTTLSIPRASSLSRLSSASRSLPPSPPVSHVG